MRTELVDITPSLARKWLVQNTANRPFRRSVADGFKDAILRGEYHITHQGVAFNEDGVLADGQHRLTAISELKQGKYPMLVTWGLPKESFKAMDIGLKRSPADALGMERSVVEVAVIFATICNTKKGKLPPEALVPFIERIEHIHAGLMEHCGQKAKTWSSAPVRAGAVLAILLGGSADYVKTTYKNLVTMNLDAMSKVSRALIRAQMLGTVDIRNQVDTIGRILTVVDPKKAGNTRVHAADTGYVNEIVREVFSDCLL